MKRIMLSNRTIDILKTNDIHVTDVLNKEYNCILELLEYIEELENKMEENKHGSASKQY